MSGKDAGALSLGAQLLLEMREDIIGGRLLPGTALVEAELVKAYNASRNTIREALHQLDREGLATYVRHKGVMVRRLGLAEVRDLFTVRRTLELLRAWGHELAPVDTQGVAQAIVYDAEKDVLEGATDHRGTDGAAIAR